MNLKTRIVFTLLAIALAGSAFASPAAPAAPSTHQSTSAPNADGPAAPPAKASAAESSTVAATGKFAAPALTVVKRSEFGAKAGKAKAIEAPPTLNSVPRFSSISHKYQRGVAKVALRIRRCK